MMDIKDPLDDPNWNPKAARPQPATPQINDPLDNPTWRPGEQFVPIQDEWADKAASMDPMDLSVARSKNDAFGRFLREQAAERKPGETNEQYRQRLYGSVGYEQEPVGAIEGTTRAGVQGYGTGYGDEIVAGGTAALDATFRGVPFSDAYDVRLARERDKLERFRESNPVLAYGGEAAGAVGMALNPALAGPRVNSLLGNSLIQGVNAGAQGFAYGFGQGEGGAGNRAGQGAMTGALAVPFGLASPFVGAGARNVVDSISAGRAAKALGMSKPATRALAEFGPDSAESFARAQGNVAAGGRGAMLADATPGYRKIVNTTVAKSRGAGEQAMQAVTQRVDDATQQFNQALDDVMGPPQGVRGTARNIAQSTSGARGDAYEAAYSTPIDYAGNAGRAIEDALDRIDPDVLQQAVKKANARMRAAGQKNMQIMASVADDGSVTFKEMPNVEQLDQIKRALDGIGRESVDKFGRTTDDGLLARDLAKNLRDRIKDAVPEYAEALRAGGDKIALDEALDLGRNVFKPSATREIVAEAAQNMTDAERRMAAQGMRAQIDETLANVKRTAMDPNVEAREALKGLKDLSSRAAKEKAVAILGMEKASRLFQQLDEVSQAFALQADIARNSDTFMRQATDQAITDAAEGGIVNAVRRGEPLNAAQRTAQALLGGTDEVMSQRGESLRRELARVLTETRGQQATGMLGQIYNRTQPIGQNAATAQELGRALMMGNSRPAASRIQSRLGTL